MSVFKFKHFDIKQSKSAMKVGTDAMVFGAFIYAEEAKNALDIGTGTGVLSLMLVQNHPSIKVTAIEIEEQAFEEAKENFIQSNYNKQLEIILGNFLNYEFVQQFDFIFSNPPFFENAYLSENKEKNLARHTYTMLFASFFRKINLLLSEKGKCSIILPYDIHEQIKSHLAENSLFISELITVYGKAGKPVRHIYSFGKQLSETQYKDFVIRNEDGTYTQEYKVLTKDFHYNQL